MQRLCRFSLSSQSPSMWRHSPILTPHGTPPAFFTEVCYRFSVYVKGLASLNAQSLQERELPYPTENTERLVTTYSSDVMMLRKEYKAQLAARLDSPKQSQLQRPACQREGNERSQDIKQFPTHTFTQSRKGCRKRLKCESVTLKEGEKKAFQLRLMFYLFFFSHPKLEKVFHWPPLRDGIWGFAALASPLAVVVRNYCYAPWQHTIHVERHHGWASTAYKEQKKSAAAIKNNAAIWGYEFQEIPLCKRKQYEIDSVFIYTTNRMQSECISQCRLNGSDTVTQHRLKWHVLQQLGTVREGYDAQIPNSEWP
ncbi:hypothetical protein F2P81_020194 [Scophthalmus maximus]|uniref:Uncharacterized protein n=1 Tax=Scophthalmus maximus TaxID=52904 RepID=A0A6A4RZF9_SCOMX|nr:hypothetical protein F2P81_020194 [Scophthalmus maximus]